LEIHHLVPLFAAVVYTALLLVVVFNRVWNTQQKLFAWYLLAAILWTLSTFILRSDFLLEYKLLVFRIVLCASMWWAVQLYFFTRSFLGLSAGYGVYFGYASLGLFIVLVVLGYIPPGLSFDAGAVSPTYSWWLALYVIHFLVLVCLGIYYLIRRFRSISEPGEYNKIAYLIIAIIILVLFGFSGITPLAKGIPISHFGGLLSAITMTYAIVRHELVSVNLILRRTLAWSGVVVVGVGVYTVLFFLVYLLVGVENTAAFLTLTMLAAIAMALMIYWLRNFFITSVDRLLLRESYHYRQELSDFIRYGIRGVYSLQELMEGLLLPLVKALDCREAHILLLTSDNKYFINKFSEPEMQKDVSLKIKNDGPIASWLKSEKKYLSCENLDIYAEFQGVWQQEKTMITKLDIHLLFPLLSRGNLIGILALSRKLSGKYSVEDTNLVESIASQVAISIEKEHFQEELQKREQELSLINRLAGVITSNLNISEVYDIFINGLREVMDVDFTSVALIEDSKLHISALSSNVESPWQVGDEVDLHGTSTEWTIANKRSLTEPDLRKDSVFKVGKEYIKLGIRSIVYLPLFIKGEGIGSLIIASKKPREYSREQINLLERLASQISTAVDNARLYSRVEEQARIDDLTGLFNRRHFDEILGLEVERHSRYGNMLALAILDLDNFKHYNDAMGHLMGDNLLRQVGTALKKALRTIDMAFRYGGDEFAVVMPHTEADDALAAIERVRHIISSNTKVDHMVLTLSVGLASWPNDGLTPDDLINAADQALYHAKRTGGDRTCLVSQMLPSVSKPFELTSAVEKETLNTIYALASTIEARDPYTYGHSRKVRAYAVALAEALGLPSDKVAVVSHSALLHDIGKIGILDGILNKAGKLDEREMELIKTHPNLSRTIVGHIPSLTPCLPAILHHHERWDGEGYPSGLVGEAIPIEARILSVADTFDAMTSLRPYRNPLSIEDAIAELKRCAGTQFDPELIEIFLPIALSKVREEVIIEPKPDIHD
jgi:diguanylate cyclase (GGDEF)-like protein